MWQANVVLTRQTLPKLEDYRCIKDGTLLFKINRDLLSLWFGAGYPVREIPLGMGWVQHKCKNCQMMYNFYWQ